MLSSTDDNLYIGTSASEILHLVSLPGESESDPPQFILATRLQPSAHANAPNVQYPGVQQILLLPGALRACILCNGTASFYTLPELSPAFPGKEPNGVQWIGGIDDNEGRDNSDGAIIMIANSRRILQVRVGDKVRALKNNIEFPGCLRASRRGTIACVADEKSYSLLEIEQQQKIPLFDISSISELEPPQSSHLTPSTQGGSHARSTSLGDFATTSVDRTASPDKQTNQPSESIERSNSPLHGTGTGLRPTARPHPSTVDSSLTVTKQQALPSRRMQPHVLSPSPNEFMLTTGTSLEEPGVGMFVNLDGDVSRGTLEFDRYPEAVLAYTFPSPTDPELLSDDAQLIIALLNMGLPDQSALGLQIQNIAAENDSSAVEKAWLSLPRNADKFPRSQAGLRQSLSTYRHVFPEVADLLRAVRYNINRQSAKETNSLTNPATGSPEREDTLIEPHPNDTDNPNADYDQKRSAEELKFAQRLGHVVTSALTWSDGGVWYLLPNPLLLQLESELLKALVVADKGYDYTKLNVSSVLSLLGSLREREPQDETEFLSVKYLRQKASFVLFLHLLTGLKENRNPKAAYKVTETALHEGELDPRVPLSLLQPLSREILHASSGIWIHQGILDCLSMFESPIHNFAEASTDFWLMVKHYLSTWQEKRGFGSIDDKTIFDTCDAALLHVLLYLDSSLPKSDSAHAPTRAKLENVVDHWKGDFDRAVALLEQYKRLFILSRLYQSKKSSKDVLNTWKRICEGEENLDDQITVDQVLNQIRRYLTVIRDTALVREYCVWLAKRSPDLAVQVLSDDNSRVKFAPAQVVTMLKANAPGSVQLFLEHLVFGKNLDQYADDLVGYYLDSVIRVLEDSEQARQSLTDSYTTYRALTSPKPTYFNFITENAPPEPWWQSRLRLLQLLGTGGYATAAGPSKTLTYSVDKVLERLEPFSKYLVSESIILDARQGRHNEALKLLVHGLGDYDTAVRYCYFGGPSSPSGTIDASMLPPREQQRQQFRVLFDEFLQIEDIEERLDRMSHLLGTFATWFDPLDVLNRIPDSWTVSQLSEFLLRTFRAATTEKNQAIIIKALSAAQNLQKQAEFIETCEKLGAKFETAGDEVPDQPSEDIAAS